MNLGEILCVVAGDLHAVAGDDLGEIAVAIKQSDRDQVDVHVASLLKVVTREQTETSRIDPQGCIQTILHAEVGHHRIRPLGFEGHVVIELIHDGIEPADEFLILGKGLELLQADHVEQRHRVVLGLVPYFRIDGLEQGLRGLVPAPPEVLGQSLEA